MCESSAHLARILAAVVFQVLDPLLVEASVPVWRVLMWTGVLPALLVLWIRKGIPESPVWLERRRDRSTRTRLQVRRYLRADVIAGAVVLMALMFAYQSMSFWYATLLRTRGLAPLVYLIALNVGGITGAALWGFVADTAFGPRKAIALATLLSLASVPFFLLASSHFALVAGALGIGLAGAGVIGVAPSFVGNLFDPEKRATGWGIVYHGAAAVGAIAPWLIGSLQDRGWALSLAMAVCIGAASVVTLAFVRPLRTAR